jgi:hypothetical protein
LVNTVADSIQAAAELRMKIEEMRTELFIMWLREPQPNERTVLKL